MSKTTKSAPAERKLEPLLNYILLFIVCAFIGWVWEVVLTFVKTGGFVNRGVLHGPWLPLYGFGGVLLALLLEHFKKYPLAVFGMSVLICGLLEYGTGWYLETFKHLKWWDYSDLPFNLDGRICLLSLICFGFLGLFMLYVLKLPLFRAFNRIPLPAKSILCVVIVLGVAGDALYATDHPNTGEGITNELSQTQFLPASDTQ